MMPTSANPHPDPASPGEPPAQPSRDQAPGSTFLVGLFAVALAVLAILLYTARIRHPGPESGEFWSDANVINGCRGFDQAGFTATWGIPRIQLAAPIDDVKALYLTYPPGPYWLTYAAWRTGDALGIDPVLAARVFAQTCGLASAILFFLLAARLSRSRAIGALAGLFYILSPAFLSYSAALHHMAYSPMLLFAAMRCWLAFEDARGSRRIVWLALTAALFAADCWVNLEHMFFFALFVAARTLCHFRWPIILGAALVGPIPIPMMALRVLHNAQVMGGWDASLAKFRGAANRRSTGGRLGVDLSDLALSWATRLGLPVPPRAGLNMFWNQEFVYPAASPWVLCVLALIILSVALHRLARPPSKKHTLALSLVDPRRAILPLHEAEAPGAGPKLLLWPIRSPGPVGLGLLAGFLLLAGGLTWFVVMTQHTQPHRFIVLLLMPGLAMLLGTAAWCVIASARAATRDSAGSLALWLRARAWLIALGLLAAFAASIRQADVLNQLAPLDASARRMALSRLETNDRTRLLGPALAQAGVQRIHMFDGANMMPWRAAAIGLPFFYARQQMPETLEPGDAIYAEAWDQVEVVACLDAVARFGLPDLAAPPGDRVLVFRGDRPAGQLPGEQEAHLRVPLVQPAEAGAGGVWLTRLRWSRSHVGDTYALAMLLEGELGADDPDAALNRFTLTLRVRAASGDVAAEQRTRIRWTAIRDDSRALVIMTVPAEAVTPGSVAELAIWDRRERIPVAFPAETPPPLEVRGRLLRWPGAATKLP